MKKMYRSLLTKHWKANLVIVFIMITNALLTILLSQITIDIIDNALANGLKLTLLCRLIEYLIIGVSQSGIVYLQAVLSTKLAQKISLEIRTDLIDRLLDKNINYLFGTRIGDIQETINADAEILTSFLTDTVYSTISNLFVAVSLVIYLSILQWDLLLIVILIQPLVYLSQVFFGKRVYRKSEETRDAGGEYMSVVQEIITNASQFITFGLKTYCIGLFSKAHRKLNDASLCQTKTTMLSESFLTIVSLLLFVTILGLGGYKIQIGAMTMGIMIAFIQYSQQLLQPFNELFNLKVKVEEARPSFERIMSINESDSYTDITDTGKVSANSISYENVSFGYEENIPVIQNFSAKFVPGKIYGIVGKSGSGKSTLFNLLLRLCRPQSGRIVVGGDNIDSIPKEEFYNQLSYIAQIPFIINGTVKENIVLNLKDVSDEDVSAAIRLAGLAEDIRELPGAVDYNVEDRGMNLSVGQRQRIGIARAFLRNTPILIFDEPTASIDGENTCTIVESLRTIKQNHIIIVVTHDSRVIESCDEVITLDE